MLSSSEFSDRIDTEPEIMNALASNDLDSKLYLLNSIQGSAVIAYSLQKIAWSQLYVFFTQNKCLTFNVIVSSTFALDGAFVWIVHVDKQAYLICLLSEILQYLKPKGITVREGDVSKILKVIIEKVKSFID